jgi:branched-chain amino acid aminotransferase
MNEIYYVDGVYVEAVRAALPLHDLALIRGYGVFDFLRTYGRRPFHLEDHIARLAQSAASVGIELPHSPPEICRIVLETLDRNPHLPEANIRILVTGGDSADSLIPDGRGRLVVMVTPNKPYPAEWYENGVEVITVPAGRPMPEAKTTEYLAAVIALREAKRRGAVEAIYVDEQGRILEGTTTNVFFFRGNTLISSDRKVLPGITRKVVLSLAVDHFAVELRDILLPELLDIDEAFFCSSSREIVPISRIDGTVVGDGRPGARTHEISEAFRAYCRTLSLPDCRVD